MDKIKIIFISLLFIARIAYSQEENKITPIHFVKLDLWKSGFSQLHFDYERSNGKNSGWEFGVDVFYPSQILIGLNEHFVIPTNNFAFQYKGLGMEVLRKFYLKNKNFYLAPAIVYAYKYFNNKKVLMAGESSSSYAVWYNVSQKRYMYSIMGFVGWIHKLETGLTFEFNVGLGYRYVDETTVVNDWGRNSFYHIPTEGHNIYNALNCKLGVKLCFAFKGKSK
jgi:hypothetical protein